MVGLLLYKNLIIGFILLQHVLTETTGDPCETICFNSFLLGVTAVALERNLAPARRGESLICSLERK